MEYRQSESGLYLPEAGIERPRLCSLMPGLLGFGAGGGGEQNFYQDIVDAGLTSGLQMVLDAGSAASYSGSGQSWLDLAGSGYDFFRGADGSAASDDPTFNGSSGGLSSSEYWSYDGGDHFRYDASNEAWMDNIHQNSAKFSILMWLYHIDLAGDSGLMGDMGQIGGTTGIGLKWGMGITSNNVPAINITNNSHVLLKGATTVLNNAAWNLVGITIDEATGAGAGFHYLNGAYNQVSGANTFDATYASPSAAGATYTMEIGATGNAEASSLATANSRVAGVMAWEGAVITKANMDTLWTAQKGRFGL